MRHPLLVPMAPGKKLVAGVCLFAILMLWSPLWAAAWQARSMACCNSGLCPVHGYAHSPQPTPQPPSDSAPDCGHHSATHKQAVNCSMSCCHGSADSLTASVTFVLPARSTVFDGSEITAVPRQSSPTDLAASFEPPSPPPRAVFLSL